MLTLSEVRLLEDQEVQLLPWEAEPHKLWSLWDMLRFSNAAFITAFLQLERQLGFGFALDPLAETANFEWRSQAKTVLREMGEECALIGLDRHKEKCDRLVSSMDVYNIEAASALLTELRNDIQREMTRHAYFLVPENVKSVYDEDDKPLFGAAVDDAFPNSRREIAEAGRCLALDRWTACVFHLMRALELALHKWAADIGVDFQSTPVELKNWNNVLDRAERHLKELRQHAKSNDRDQALQYHSELVLLVRGVKDAWRNHVSHARVTYDQRAATSIWNNVRDIMNRIASSPNFSISSDDT